VITSLVSVGLAVALLAGQQPNRPLTAEEAVQAILVIEDNRTGIPDALESPAIDAWRQRIALDLKLLVDLTQHEAPAVRRLAIRALGRAERRDVIPHLLSLLQTGPGADISFALAQAMRGAPLPTDDPDQQLRVVLDALLNRGTNLRREGFASTGDRSLLAEDPALPEVVRSLGRLPYTSPEQVLRVDAYFANLFARLDPDQLARPRMAAVADAVESLTRLHRKLARPGEATLDWLRRIVEGVRRTYPEAARVAAMRALVTAQEMHEDTLRVAAREAQVPELRRLAAISLTGAGATVPDTERTILIQDLLRDPEPMVRIEAVRAWARHETATHGCNRLFDVFNHDPAMHVVIATIGVLATACPSDPNVTELLTNAARTPPAGNWHREAHALVALARRAPARAGVPVRAFVKDPQWHVRMYAARAAAILEDEPLLERLAYDPVDQVREAALPVLRRLKGPEIEPFLLDALKRDDYQLLLTSAREMRDLPPTPALTTALASALMRLTGERIETSRDTRLALLERLAVFGNADNAGTIMPLLRDFDVEVAAAAAATIQAWTGEAHVIDPQLLARPPVPSSAEMAKAAEEVMEIQLAGGRSFDIRLLTDVAPLTGVTFMRLAGAGYYDDKPIHRVVPNFVVQGPGEGEYSRLTHYARDERGPLLHRRGTVGLSTRGRDTGDMQLFVNMVDNPRLNYEYTIFGVVSDEHMAIVDRILEGDVIRRIRIKPKKEK
jgi:cyclophilin family peptidyl-prolyl cis-trans isomerase/HEAT repeat protein